MLTGAMPFAAADALEWVHCQIALDSGEFVGLCYGDLDKDSPEWEIGGLTITEAVQRLGLGSVLARFALAHTIANQRPWNYGQEIIAHVHEENPKPRKLLNELGFEFVKKEELSGATAPASMKRNGAGNVVGDKFQFVRERVRDLSGWFNEFNGKIPDSDIHIAFNIPLGAIDWLRQALQQAGSARGKQTPP